MCLREFSLLQSFNGILAHNPKHPVPGLHIELVEEKQTVLYLSDASFISRSPGFVKK